MTMGGLILFTLVTLMTFSSSASETKFTGAMDLLDRFFLEGFGFCGVICVAPNVHIHVNKTLYQCQNNMMEIANETRRQSHLYKHDKIYDFAIRRQGSSTSRMCRWAHSVVDGCAGQLVKDHCDHSGIKREMNMMMQQSKAYVCSLDPPVMECALHPEVEKKAPLCAAPLKAQFGKYFNATVRSREERTKQFQRFYNGEIKTNNGENLYNAFKMLGTCVSTLIGQSSVEGASCSKVKDLLDAEVDNVIAYFKKTDVLKCTFDPELWRHMEECGQAFAKAMQDRVSTPDPRLYMNPDVQWNPMDHTVENFQLFAANDYQLLKDPLKAFTTCTLQSMDTVCGKKWTYTVTKTQLTLLENLFNPKDKTVPDHCEALIQKQQETSASTSEAVRANMAMVILLRLLMMFY